MAEGCAPPHPTGRKPSSLYEIYRGCSLPRSDNISHNMKKEYHMQRFSRARFGEETGIKCMQCEHRDDIQRKALVRIRGV